MTSRLPYPHVVNRFLEGKRPMSTVMLLVVTVFLAVTHLLETVVAAFVLYAVSGILLYALARTTGWPRWALREETDEAEDVEDDEDEADEDEADEDGEGADGEGADGARTGATA